jgi:hypothetical protein
MYTDVCLDLVEGKPAEISFDSEMQFRYELPVRPRLRLSELAADLLANRTRTRYYSRFALSLYGQGVCYSPRMQAT